MNTYKSNIISKLYEVEIEKEIEVEYECDGKTHIRVELIIEIQEVEAIGQDSKGGVSHE